MNRIGIIGGLGPEATIEYYRALGRAFEPMERTRRTPEIVIYGASLTRFFELMEGEDWESLTAWLVRRIEALRLAGVGLAAIASNTPHIVFDQVRARSSIPLLSIVEETCRRAEADGLNKMGLMGTKFTMRHNFYAAPCRRRGIEVVVPREDEQAAIHTRLVTEIGVGVIKDETRSELLSIAKRMVEEDRIDGLILGCTELPLILDRDECGIPFLNTTRIHVEGIVRRWAEAVGEGG